MRDRQRNWSCLMILSNPVLAPKFLCVLAAAELEFNGDDIVEALLQRRCAEAAAKVAEGDAWQRCSGFGVLVGLGMRIRWGGYRELANAYQFFVGRSDGVVVFA